MGISLHAPGNGLSLGVGQNNFGYSWSLNGWETFKLEWWKDSQVYCLPIEQVTENNVVLSPVESMSESYKLIIIPKSETKALIVESRRATGFSSAWPKDFYGLLVYELDTTLDNDRSQECCGDSGFDKRFQKWSYPLTPDQRPFSASLNNNLDQVNNFLVRVGETVSWEGIKVTYLEKGSADYIKITRA